MLKPMEKQVESVDPSQQPGSFPMLKQLEKQVESVDSPQQPAKQNMLELSQQILDAISIVDAKLDAFTDLMMKHSPVTQDQPNYPSETHSPYTAPVQSNRSFGRASSGGMSELMAASTNRAIDRARAFRRLSTHSSTGKMRTSAHQLGQPVQHHHHSSYHPLRGTSRRSSAAQPPSCMGTLEEKLQVRPGYEKMPNFSPTSSVAAGRYRAGTTKQTKWLNVQIGNSVESRGNMRWKAWNPDSLSRTIFEVTSLVMLLYDAFVVPYQLAWRETENEGVFAVAVWITRIFWTVDLSLNTVTGYRDQDAKLILELRAAAWHYVRTWFVADLALVTLDWLTLLRVSSAGGWIQYVRVCRLLRGGRQVIRGWTLVLKAKLMIQVPGFHLVMDIAMLMMVILWVNHVISCGWFSIGTNTPDSDTGVTWLSSQMYTSSGGTYEYLTALHWAMTQMMPGSMEVVPKNSRERVYNVAILLIGLLMGSSLVATLTSMMTQYKLRVEGASRKFMILHQFLTQQGVDPQLALAIKLQVKARSSEKERLKAKDVEYLSLLSNSLSDALWHAWCSRHLSEHAFLGSLSLIDSLAMETLSKNALKTLELPAGDAVFDEGETGEFMYFVVGGRLQYCPGDYAPENMLAEDDPKLLLRSGSWCCEPALWTLWSHLGSLEALTTAEILALSSPSFQATMMNYPAAFHVTADYCSVFHKYIQEPGVLKSDLAGIDIAEVIASLSSETRMQLATPAINRLEARLLNTLHRHEGKQRGLDLLKQEVANGKCFVALSGTEVIRNTFVVALRISRDNAYSERFLVKVGEVMRAGHIVGSCLLPGVKRKWRESNPSVVDRVLADDLGELSEKVQLRFQDGVTQTITMQDSPTYGIRTRYARTTFLATMVTDPKVANLYSPIEPLRASPFTCSRMMAMLRPESRRREVMQEEIAAVLAEHRCVLVVHCSEANKASRKMYLWLNPAEFEILSRPLAKPMIEHWLSSTMTSI